MARIAIVGTELAPLEGSSGALERVVLSWASGLENHGHTVDLVSVDGEDDPPVGVLEHLSCDLAVLNNRPLWSEHVSSRCLHVLHNFPDAWGAGTADDRRVARALSRHRAVAVSRALARAVEERYGAGPVGVVDVEVEACFFETDWHGTGGPVLFPNRLLEKKGVRLFLALAGELAERDLACVMFRHLAPWSSPTAEQALLLEAIGTCPAVRLLAPPVDRAEMASWYGRAAVVVCPSIRPEGLGLVALEAQAVGAPLVTSGLGGLAEVTFAPNELVVDADVRAWAAAVCRTSHRVVPDPGPREIVRQRYGATARYSLERIIDGSS